MHTQNPAPWYEIFVEMKKKKRKQLEKLFLNMFYSRKYYQYFVQLCYNDLYLWKNYFHKHIIIFTKEYMLQHCLLKKKSIQYII